MPNDDRARRLPRFLALLLRTGAGSEQAEAYDRLAAALARELPMRALPLALLRLRRHLGAESVSRRARAPRRSGPAAPAP